MMTARQVSFTSYLKPGEDAERTMFHCWQPMPVVVPVNKTVKLIMTSDPGGLSTWTIPSFGLKIDAVPGA
jgi:heme/copper-type cytochrome/quinol oxidase subunit 2